MRPTGPGGPPPPWPGPPGPGGFIDGFCSAISSCLSLLCCCWLLQDCFGGPPLLPVPAPFPPLLGPPGPFGGPAPPGPFGGPGPAAPPGPPGFRFVSTPLI